MISVLIVNWNSRTYLRQCLLSLFTHCRSIPLEVIVVDGASFDGCGEMLAEEFPSVVFVQSNENVGFAKANNSAARYATGDYFLLLNPDTLFVEDSIRVMLEQLQSLPDAGAVGCRLLNADRSLQTSCVQAFPTVLNQMLVSDYLLRRFPAWKFWGVAPLYALPPKPAVVEVISGACILLARSTFNQVGGFSENYFMYGEDLDLCFKLRRSGLFVYHVPLTSVVHLGGGSTGQTPSRFSEVMMRESVGIFMTCNYGRFYSFVYRCAMTLSAIIRVLTIVPLLFFGNRLVKHGMHSWQKWFAILLWSVGLEPQKPAPPTPAQAITPAPSK